MDHWYRVVKSSLNNAFYKFFFMRHSWTTYNLRSTLRKRAGSELRILSAKLQKIRTPKYLTINFPWSGPLEHWGDTWSNEHYIMSFGAMVKYNFGTLDFVLEPRPEKYYKRKRLVIHTAKCFIIFYKLSYSSITESVFNLAHLNLHI